VKSEKLDSAKAYTDLLLIRLYQKLRCEAEKIGWDGLYDMCQNRIADLEDEYSRLTGRRIHQ